MIRFPCRCKFALEVGDAMAGGAVQCPKCGRLNDVPTIDDAGHIDDDGAYKLDADRPAADGRSAADRRRQTVELLRAGGRDERGDSRDLRPTIDEYLATGMSADPAVAADAIKPARPHYDPLTGELVRPLDLVRDAPPTVPPSKAGALGRAEPAAPKPLTYANRHTDPNVRVPPRHVPLELFKPGNVTVLLFVLLAHVLLVLPLALPYVAVVLAFLPMLALFLAIVGHYGNVIEEIGPVKRDELPTPMRDFSFGDDIWLPAVRVLGSAMLCFGPSAVGVVYVQYVALAALSPGSPPPPVDPDLVRWAALAGVAVGGLFFPAVVLTATTAGAALVNLAPARVLGTAVACGRGYVLAVALLLVTAFLYVLGLRSLVYDADLPFGWDAPGVLGEVLEYAIGLPALLTGIYFAHGFCWWLGLMYRAHHARFPWRFQKFEGKRTDTMRQLEERRAARRAQAADAVRDGQPRAERSPQRVLPID